MKGASVSNVAVDCQEESRERSDELRAYAGYEVHDPEGREIGRVHELLVDANGEPKYVRLKTGPFGLKSALVPVHLVAADTERHILLLR